MTKYKNILLALAFLSIATFSHCRYGDDGLTVITNENQFDCNDGFIMNAAGDACLCESPKIRFGNAECLDSIPSHFTFAALEGCPGAMAVNLSDDFNHDVIHDGVAFDRYDMTFIQMRPSVSGLEINETTYLKKSLSDGVDSIIFTVLIGSYFDLDTVPLLPEFLFEGVRTDSATLTGTVSWGPSGGYWKIRETYGSCRASFNLLR